MPKSDLDKFVTYYNKYGPKIVKWFVAACFIYAALILGSLLFLFLIA